jgi:ABC-type multidrug transport system ATPase subunit
VQVSGVSKRFPARRGLKDTLLHPFDRTRTTVVSDVTFTTDAGEFLGLLGPNGAGKTTLLKMLSRWFFPTLDRSPSVDTTWSGRRRQCAPWFRPAWPWSAASIIG